MTKALVVSAALALALSGAAFAKGESHANRGSQSAETTHFTEADCRTLTVESARSACVRSMDGEHHVVGSTRSEAGGEGLVQVKHTKHAKHRKHRVHHRNPNANRG